MQIQMVLLNDRKDDIQDEDSLNTKEKKVIKEEEIEQQAVVDNRLQGDKTNKIYQSYYGVVRNMLDSNKKISSSLTSKKTRRNSSC